MKIGDLVRRHRCTRLGIVVDTTDNDGGLAYVKVRWGGGYGTFWTSHKAIEVVGML